MASRFPGFFILKDKTAAEWAEISGARRRAIEKNDQRNEAIELLGSIRKKLATLSKEICDCGKPFSATISLFLLQVQDAKEMLEKAKRLAQQAGMCEDDYSGLPQLFGSRQSEYLAVCETLGEIEKSLGEKEKTAY